MKCSKCNQEYDDVCFHTGCPQCNLALEYKNAPLKDLSTFVRELTTDRDEWKETAEAYAEAAARHMNDRDALQSKLAASEGAHAVTMSALTSTCKYLAEVNAEVKRLRSENGKMR